MILLPSLPLLAGAMHANNPYFKSDCCWGTPFYTVLDKIAAASRQQPGGVTVIDCGANNGAWLDSIIVALKRNFSVKPRSVHPVWIDPQPQFASRLKQRAAAHVNGRYIRAAAWNANTTLTFHPSMQSASSSLIKSAAQRYGSFPSVTVKAFDMANYIRKISNTTTIVMKMDIESAEYVVLPHLMASGVLCSIDFLRMEWHLNGNPPRQRMAALALQHALPAILSGCPWRVHLEAQSDTNMNRAAIPDLPIINKYHSGDDTWDSSKRVSRNWKDVMPFVTLAKHAVLTGQRPWFPTRVVAGRNVSRLQPVGSEI